MFISASMQMFWAVAAPKPRALNMSRRYDWGSASALGAFETKGLLEGNVVEATGSIL